MLDEHSIEIDSACKIGIDKKLGEFQPKKIVVVVILMVVVVRVSQSFLLPVNAKWE